MTAGELIGRRVYDRDGRLLGRVSDLIAQPSENSAPAITAVVVAPRFDFRLLRVLSRTIGRRYRTFAWQDIRVA